MVPRCHTQPSMLDGQMVVFAAEKRRPLLPGTAEVYCNFAGVL